MDRFDAMATLIAAVDAGSLSAASRSLGTPLATVSRKVADLEARLGTRLLVRTSRHLALTEAGGAYVAAARRILEHLDEAERLAAGEYRAPRGDLTVTAPVLFGRLHVEPVVLEFLTAYPDIKVRLILADRVVNLVEDHIDVAVRIGQLPDSSLVASRLGAIGRVVCASPEYFAARGTPRIPGDLSRHDCIAFEGRYSSTNWVFRDRLSEVSVHVRPRLVVNAAEAAIDAALASAGITRVLSYQVAASVSAGALVVALADFEPDEAPVSLVYSSQPLLPLKLRAFLDFAAPRLRAALARIPELLGPAPPGQ